MGSTIIKTKAQSANFTIFPKAVSESTEISWNAKGILCYLLGKPDGWKTRIVDIVNHGKLGEDGVRAALNELRKAGYAKLTKVVEKGRVKEWVWQISDCPIFNSPDGENPDLTFPDLKNPDHSNKDSSNNHPKKKEGNGALRLAPFPSSMNEMYDIMEADLRYDATDESIQQAILSVWNSGGKIKGKPMYDWISCTFARAEAIYEARRNSGK